MPYVRNESAILNMNYLILFKRIMLPPQSNLPTPLSCVVNNTQTYGLKFQPLYLAVTEGRNTT